MTKCWVAVVGALACMSLGCSDDSDTSGPGTGGTGNAGGAGGAVGGAGGGGGTGGAGGAGAGGAADYGYEQLGPPGGFISAIVFHPENPGEVWASGDDTGGLYRSQDGGASWQTLPMGEHKDRATYALRFDPADANRIYSPSHFGRGLLVSTDGGATWNPSGTGLPDASAPGNQRRIFDLEISPLDSNLVFAATGVGLYKSTDAGGSFTQVTGTNISNETGFRAIAFAADGRLFAGGEQQGVYVSADGGGSWTTIIPTGGVNAPAVTDIVAGDNALYMGFQAGVVWKTDTFSNAGLVQVSDPTGSTTCVVRSGLWTKLAVVSGATAAQDTVYLGSVAVPGSTQWGFFVSSDGGGTCTRMMTGLDENSVFVIAVNPDDPSHIVLGTVGGGIYRSLDAGASWQEANGGIYSTAVLGFAEDPSDTDHLIASSMTAFENLPGVYESHDAGATWTELLPLRTHAVSSLSIDPTNPDVIIAGTFGVYQGTERGIYRSTTGPQGPWVQRLDRNVRVQYLVRDTVEAATVYASATKAEPPATNADVGIYVSLDGGDTWPTQLTFGGLFVAARPGMAGEAVAVGTDGFATTDAFATPPASLGLADAAPGDIFTAVAFAPYDADALMVGTAAGRLFVTTAYEPAGMNASDWTEQTVPSVDAPILALAIVDPSRWYASAVAVDTTFLSTTQQGIMRSTNQGADWHFIHAGIGPAEAVYGLTPSVRSDTPVYLSMWGKSLLLLSDPS